MSASCCDSAVSTIPFLIRRGMGHRCFVRKAGCGLVVGLIPGARSKKVYPRESSQAAFFFRKDAVWHFIRWYGRSDFLYRILSLDDCFKVAVWLIGGDIAFHHDQFCSLSEHQFEIGRAS